jgi:hypothetical protein
LEKKRKEILEKKRESWKKNEKKRGKNTVDYYCNPQLGVFKITD